MEAVIDTDLTVDELELEWSTRYDSRIVDDIEAQGVEVDGGIDWDTMTIRTIHTSTKGATE